MADLPSTTAPPGVGMDLTSRHGKPTGLLPPFPEWDPAFKRFFEKYRLAETYNALSQEDYVPILNPDGTYHSSFSSAVWKNRAKILNADLPTAPGTKSGPFQQVVHSDYIIPDTDIKLRIYHPAQSSAAASSTPVYLYGHGGGMYTGSEKSADDSCSRIVHSYGIPAVSFDYRKGPEHKYPGGHEDARTALEWVRNDLATYLSQYNADGSVTEIDRVVFGGTSSGANLLLSTLNTVVKENQESTIAHDKRKQVPIVGGVFSVPVCSVALQDYGTENWKKHHDNPMMNSDIMTWMTLQHARTPKDLTDPRWSIVHEDPKVLADLPPITIFTAELDALRESALLYAQLVNAAGGSVTLDEYKGLGHTAQGLDGVCEEARRVNTELIKAVGRTAGISEEIIEKVTVESLYPTSLWQAEDH